MTNERVADVLKEADEDPNARTEHGLVELNDEYLERIIRAMTGGREGLARPTETT